MEGGIKMKTKHTHGVWVSSGYRVDVDVADGLSGICEMSDWMSDEEMEANAKLIAAAPELLEAEIQNLEFLKWLATKSMEFNMWSDKVQLLYERIAKTESAIKKAIL